MLAKTTRVIKEGCMIMDSESAISALLNIVSDIKDAGVAWGLPA